MKNFKSKKDGSYWSIWSSETWTKIGGDFVLLDFYPFPTLKFSYHEDTFETDEYDFNIELVWLLWVIHITKYWGKAYQFKEVKI